MSVAKDKSGKWYSKFRYKDWTGKTIQKKKTGFSTKREATAWERDFLAKVSSSPNMSFKALCELYLDDLVKRVKRSTYDTQKSDIDKHLLPVFGDMPINDISNLHIRNWYHSLDSMKDSTKSKIYRLLNIILNFAVRFHGLSKNPATGVIRKDSTKREGMDFYTLQEFNVLMEHVDNVRMHCLLNVLFYSGIRVGELQALTLNDFDFDNDTMSVNKSFSESQGITTTPKSKTSIRVLTMPHTIMSEVLDYSKKLYDLSPSDRLFEIGKTTIKWHFDKYSKIAGLRHIRIHDLRHSHASMLIHLGYPVLVISKRLGHANVSTTLNIYAHLYEDTEKEVAIKLDEIIKNGTNVVQIKSSKS